jgi:hypothetical protein
MSTAKSGWELALTTEGIRHVRAVAQASCLQSNLVRGMFPRIRSGPCRIRSPSRAGPSTGRAFDLSKAGPSAGCRNRAGTSSPDGGMMKHLWLVRFGGQTERFLRALATPTRRCCFDGGNAFARDRGVSGYRLLIVQGGLGLSRQNLGAFKSPSNAASTDSIGGRGGTGFRR